MERKGEKPGLSRDSHRVPDVPQRNHVRTFSSSPSFILRASKRDNADRETAPTLAVVLDHCVFKPHGAARPKGVPTKAAVAEDCPVHELASAVPAAAARRAHVLIMVRFTVGRYRGDVSTLIKEREMLQDSDQDTCAREGGVMKNPAIGDVYPRYHGILYTELNFRFYSISDFPSS